MGTLSYMRSVGDRNVVMRRTPVLMNPHPRVLVPSTSFYLRSDTTSPEIASVRSQTRFTSHTARPGSACETGNTTTRLLSFVCPLFFNILKKVKFNHTGTDLEYG
jgi:hypothetical protein